MGKHDAPPLSLTALTADGRISVEEVLRPREEVRHPDRPYRWRTERGALAYFSTAERAFGHARKNILVTGKVDAGEAMDLRTGRGWRLVKRQPPT